MKTSIIFLVLLASCGKEVTVINRQGVDGISLVSETGVLYPNTACASGGSILSLYKDLNRDGRVTLGVDTLENIIIVCNGKDGADGDDGQRGLAGADGAKGDTGAAGTNGAKGDTGAIGSTGANGAAGVSGTNSIMDIIDLRHTVCGLPTVNFSEVIIKLADGRMLSSFSDNDSGKNTRFTILVPGITYSTTDGNSCRFRITANGNVERL